MEPFVGNLENITISNNAYRHVLFTDKLQLVVMRLGPNEEIGREIHATTTQFIRIEEGEAVCTIGRNPDSANDEIIYLSKNGQDTVIIPQGTYHNIINKSKTDLRLYTIYSPPEHPPQTYQKNKFNKNLYNKFKKMYKTMDQN